MIKEDTVFILGAGASLPFGYPTGIKLREIIIDNLSDPDSKGGGPWAHRYKILEELRYSRKEIREFRKEFFVSTLYSIDAFLEYRPEFIEIGKIAIADALIQYEDEEALFSTHNNWYAYLFNRLNSKFDDFTYNKIAFITFNYDRSLEQYLYRVLMSTYGKTSREVIDEVINKIPIYHLYGKLGDLEWQSSNGQSYNYQRRLVAENLRYAASQIHIISEKNKANFDTLFEETYKLLKKASYIYFLGFGYDKTNLDRIKIKEFYDGKNVLGSAYNIETSKRHEIFQYFNSRIQLDEDNLDVLGFFKKYVSF